VFSNLASEPIEDGGELNKGEKGEGEFFIASRDAAMDFDATEEVFDLVAAAVVAAMESDALTASSFGWNATSGPLLAQLLAENVGIESFVGDDPVSSGPRQHRANRMLVVLRSG